jgi:hypothetical protein
MYTCSFITHLDGTRKWTGCHPVWIEFLNLFVSLLFEDVFLLVSPMFVSLNVSLLPFLKEAIKATRSPCCLRTCVPRSAKLGGHLQFVRFGRFLRNLLWVICHWVKVVLYFLQSVIATEWPHDIFKWNRHKYRLVRGY